MLSVGKFADLQPRSLGAQCEPSTGLGKPGQDSGPCAPARRGQQPPWHPAPAYRSLSHPLLPRGGVRSWYPSCPSWAVGLGYFVNVDSVPTSLKWTQAGTRSQDDSYSM